MLAGDQLHAIAPAPTIAIKDLTALILLVGIDPKFGSALNSVYAKSVADSLSFDDITSLALEAESRIGATHEVPHTLSANIAIAEELFALKHSTCSNESHRHPGGDDQCYDMHPELKPRLVSSHVHIGRSTC